ncbi:hypothetical protein QAD02_007954 [Eretmocerus hayati]|uniref:Uncharacterized protein n=1 Tax=Eretmocerus hayati TaxID=131215 RepID=A0ACC2N5F1_9HYME|nr:hypothetical protein QAD02_007954 [Eretmocerus hayati]
MSRETASPALTVPQTSAPSINQLLLAYSCGCCGSALSSRPPTASTPYSPTQTPAPTPAESGAPTPVNMSAPVLSVEVQAPHVSLASGSSSTHPFPPLDRPSSEYDLVRVVSDIFVPRVGEISVESIYHAPQRHSDLAQLIETQNYINSPPPLPRRPQFPFAGRDVAGNKGRSLQSSVVHSAGNSSFIRGENDSARDAVSSTGDMASLDRGPFPIISGLLGPNPVVELPPSELANDVLNNPREAEALEARVGADVHAPERAPKPDGLNVEPEVENARAEHLELPYELPNAAPAIQPILHRISLSRHRWGVQDGDQSVPVPQKFVFSCVDAMRNIYSLPVCDDLMYTRFRQCDERHALHEPCAGRVLECPECRGLSAYWLNIVLEREIENLYFPCQNYSFGYREFPRAPLWHEHCEQCTHREPGMSDLKRASLDALAEFDV